jgi:diaminopimelate epimerase
MENGARPCAKARLYNAAGNWVLVVDAGSQPQRAAHLAIGRLLERRFSARGLPGPDILCLLIRGKTLRAEFSNPDGSPEDMCANALRCLPLELALAPGERAAIETDCGPVEVVRTSLETTALLMDRDAISLRRADERAVLVDIGTRHLVFATDCLTSPEIEREGLALARGSQPVNATFISVNDAGLAARTFERGVSRAETGSCGTGAISAFLAARELGLLPDSRSAGDVPVAFGSGQILRVRWKAGEPRVRLSGPCTQLATWSSGEPEDLNPSRTSPPGPILRSSAD